MKWYTHAAVGANAVWLTALTGSIDNYAMLLLIAGAFAALMPDIDARRGAKIHYMAGGILGMFKGVFVHRAFFHSLLATMLVFAVSARFLATYHPLLPWVITIGYLSHPIIDGFNHPGVRYLFPIRTMYRLMPRSLATPVGGAADSLFLVCGLMGITLFVFSHFSVFAMQ